MRFWVIYFTPEPLTVDSTTLNSLSSVQREPKIRLVNNNFATAAFVLRAFFPVKNLYWISPPPPVIFTAAWDTLPLRYVHTSNNVEETFDFVEATIDFVTKNGNNVERVHRKISSFRQSSIRFDFVEKDENSFDVVAKNGNNVEATFDFVERIVPHVAFDNVALTLLMV